GLANLSITDSKYNLDSDKNGIPDGAELIKDGEILLSTDKKLYTYDSTVSLKASLISSAKLGKKLIAIDNSSKINFEVSKIISYESGLKNPKIVYTNNGNTENEDIIGQYINFKPIQLTSQNGIAKYSFTVKQEDLDIILQANIQTKDKNGNIFIDKKSDPFKILVRGDRIDVIAKLGEEIISSINAGESINGISFNLEKFDKNGNSIENDLPYVLNIYDDISNKKLDGPININSSSYPYKNKSILNKVGAYKFEFIDDSGLSTYKTITILPALIKEIRVIPSSTQFIKGSEITFLVELIDNYGNKTKGDLYNIKGEITSGPGIFSRNNLKENSISTLEGFSYFTIKANEVGNISLKFSVSNPSIESQIFTVQSLDSAKIKIDIENKDNIIVGKEKHKINIYVQDSNNQLLNKFNGVAYFDFPSISGNIEPNFVQIKNGKNVEDVYLNPNFVAGKDIKLNINIPGINDIEGNIVTILPDKPMRLGLINTKQKFEAKSGEKTKIKAVLYDRYGNITFNDSSHKINFIIPEEYKKYISFSGNSYLQTQNTNEGITDIDVDTSDLPATSFVTAKTEPALELNSFAVKDQSGNQIIINGYSEAISTIETYYIFNKEKLEGIDYNSLYTVLLGANYGDITSNSYLGGEILFNKNSRSLAVSSLINNPYNKEVAFSFTPGGKFLASDQKEDISFQLKTEITSNQKVTNINFYDEIYKNLIARAWLNFDENNTELISCNTNDSQNIDDCIVSEEKSYIVLKGFKINNFDINSSKENNSLSLNYNGFKVLNINKSGQITKDPSINLNLDENSTGNFLGIKITSNKEDIGYIGIKFYTNSLDIYKSSAFPNILDIRKNQILLEQIGDEYSYNYNFLGNSSAGTKGISFFKNDNTNNTIDRDLISFDGSKFGIENYGDEAGIGWGENNKILLEFAGGNTVGDSTKFYQTYSMINLGDPIISIDSKKLLTSDFDKTVGKKILETNGETIESYKKIDFDGDSSPDIVVFYKSGKIKLLANYKGNFKDMGFLSYIVDVGEDRKGVGDFNGDKFDDIAMVNNKGNLFILNNKAGKFTRIDPNIIDINTNKKTKINGKIQQLEVFDMDKDDKTDIVIVDDSGELNILYGSTINNGELVFQKKLVDNSFGVKLEQDPIKTGGAIYYDGLTPQLAEPGSQEEYYKQSQSLANSKGSDEIPDDNMETLVNNFIYYQYKYSVPKESYSDSEKNKVILSSVGTDDSGNPNQTLMKEISDTQKDLVSLNGSGMTDISNFNISSLEKTKTFIKSEFAYVKGIEFEKKYEDLNGGYLKGNDKIKSIIKITNNTGKTVNNVIFLDSNIKSFSIGDDVKYTLKQKGKEITKPLKELLDGEFDYVFENLSLDSNETIEINYLLDFTPSAFGKVTVGLLNKKDIYGDIGLNPNNECGATQIIYESNKSRECIKGEQKCENNSELPPELQKNTIDKDNNGIPDYIDQLNDTSNTGALKKYSEEALDEYNKDLNTNGIPDREDKAGDKLFGLDSSSLGITDGGLNSANIDAINSQIDDTVKGLGCGFGGGSCLSLPMNWAPLAPGSSPPLMGFPLIKNFMKVSKGLPTFSLLTGLQVGPYCIPFIWPPSPLKTQGCGGLGAGGWLGEKNDANFFRLYITPTITGAMGTALCFGPSQTLGTQPAQGASPIVPGGNCIVAAKPLLGCKDDGSDGDINSLGLTSYSSSSSGNAFINANSCQKPLGIATISKETQSNIEKYIHGDKSISKDIIKDPAVKNGVKMNTGPLMKIGGKGESNLDISINSNAIKNFDVGKIVKVNFKRVMAFPDFIMDWVTRQIEEIVNKLTSLPTLYIILPDFSGIMDSNWNNFFEKLKNNFNGTKDPKLGDKLKSNASIKTEENKNNDQITNISNTAKSSVNSTKDGYNKLVGNFTNEANSAGKTVSGIKAAYEFMSNLPLIQFENETIDINIPWIGFEDIDKWIISAKITAKQWESEIKRANTEWSKLGKPGDLANQKIGVDIQKLISSLEKNIEILEEYKKFPEKFLKYLRWKENYMQWAICNVETVAKITGDWIY
ncbi:VCBS repeat-containing protein, partial [Candidatus Gracilibacteria bacterium]|nr:VCBS repeat-containing protein [Candidatus Gracilibacteria bacterium]